MLEVLVIVLIVAAAGAAIYLLRKKRSGRAQVSTDAGPEEQSIDQKIGPQHQALVELNLRARNDPDRDDVVVTQLETVIDLIVKLLPDVNQRFPMDNTTFLVNQAALKYLPDLFAPYQGLSREDRASQQGQLISTLEAIESDLKKIDALIRKADLAALKLEGLFLAKRFGASETDTKTRN